MKRILILLSLLSVAACNRNSEFTIAEIDNVAQLSARQCIILDKATPDSLMPRNFKNGELVTTKGPLKGWWITGFFPGTCWYDYLLTGNIDVLNIARKRTAMLSDPDSFYSNHDIGFQVMCSSGLAYKATGDSLYLAAIKRGAELLASRFSPVTGTIESWESKNNEWKVIIDNMMNLELLVFASKQFNEPRYQEIAVTHAETTIKNHFRDNASCYHMVVYDRENGSVITKKTVQGYSDESAWSRGQAWALYGYSMMYRETGMEEFLIQAEKIAEYLLPRLESRIIPAWDFDAPAESINIDDSSAASVMASAFIELSGLTHDTAKAESYIITAKRMLKALSQPEYLAKEGELSGFILKHATGHLPKGSEIDVPLTYGDYYFLEALYRLKSRAEASRPEISWSLMHPTQLDSVYMKRIIRESAFHPVDNFEICGGCNSGCDGSLDGLLYFEEYPLAAAAQNSEIVSANRANMKSIIRMAHEIGKPVYYWHREVLCNDGVIKSIPGLMDENGEFNLLGEAYEELLRYKIRKTFECVPDLDGIVLTLTEASFSSLHNSRPDLYPPEKVVEKIGGIFAEELEARGKRFILRSFGSIDEDYNNIAKGSALLAKKYSFEVETKITPFDFNPFLPDNKFLVKTPGCTLGAECDVLGEFLGTGRMLPEQVDEIVRYVKYARTKNVDRFTIRLDRLHKSIFDVYPINLYAYEQAIMHPEKTGEQIRQEYYLSRYPEDVAAVLVQMSKDGMECVKKSEYIDGNLIFHSLHNPTLIYFKAGGIFGVFGQDGNLSRARKQWGILSDKKVPGHEAIIKEKTEAFELAKKNIVLVDSLATKLRPKDLKRLSEAWSISLGESESMLELCKLISAYFEDIKAGDVEGKSLNQAYAHLHKALDGKQLLRPIFSYADHMMEEFKVETEMRSQFNGNEKLVDYILPGTVSDQQKVEHYMLGSFCKLEGGKALAIVGNAVFPDCYLAFGLKGYGKKAVLVITGNGFCNVEINGKKSSVSLDGGASIEVPGAAEYEIRITKAQGKDYPEIASAAIFQR